MNYEFGKYNLHTHSFYCGHGIGTLKEYVNQAKKNKIELLGFSEHCPVKGDRWGSSRMDYDTKDIYLADIDSLKENEQNEDNQIKILSGFECDYFKEYDSYLSELKEKCDYLIFGVHYLNLSTYKDFPLHHYPLNSKALNIYTDQYIKSLESNLFSLAAHPDLFFIQYFKWDNQAKAISKEIIEAAIYYDIPLEVNGNGIMKNQIKGFNNDMRNVYPVKEFWQLAKSYDKLKIISNTDAHSPYNIKESFEKCDQFGKDLSLEYSKANIDNIEKNHKVEFVK
jgi:histidinol-phosphatase (PHP family)